jgi:uncharacterized phage-associated protein
MIGRGEHMPGWSPQIANELIRLAAVDGTAFDQMKLQELVYIAHGWCLALTGEPLTGDRPEALDHGPEYRRLADALARWGLERVTSQILESDDGSGASKTDATLDARSGLYAVERDILGQIYAEYGTLPTSQLATLTRAPGTPWEQIFADGAGRRRDIPHELIRSQFADIAAKSGSHASRA